MPADEPEHSSTVDPDIPDWDKPAPEVDVAGVGDPLSPFNAYTSGISGKARAAHEARTERAQTMDERQNAPVAETYDEWAENKNRRDLPGVDTIPRETYRARAKRFAERVAGTDAIDRIEPGEKGPGPEKGKFKATPSGDEYEVSVRTQPFDELDDEPETALGAGPILAHEVGHAVDFYMGGGKRTGDLRSRVLENDSELAESARVLSERLRGQMDLSDEYRNHPAELAADAVASMVVEPRAARREAPEIVDWIEESVSTWSLFDEDDLIG